MADLEPGTVFAGHRIEGVAGRGGVGVVYRATHLALDHVVALKVIAPEFADDPAWRARFVAESRAAVSIRHPNVVGVHHAGEEGGRLFVTMDLVEGTDLRQALRASGPLGPSHAAEVLAAIGSALDAAHARGLVHRDVKPSNILIELDPSGDGVPRGGERVYLSDFGLTKSIEGGADMTATGAFVGTIDYVAPEQIEGRPLDARTDVYALGCVLYEMLTGQAPYGHVEGNVAKLYGHLRESPAPLTERMPGSPRDLDDVIERALAKQPADRYASAGDLARAAQGALGGVTTLEVGTVARGEAAPRTEEAVTKLLDRDAVETSQGSGRRRGVLGVALLGAAAIAIALVLALGGDEVKEPAQVPTSAVTAISLTGVPVGMVVAEEGVWVGRRTQGSISLIDPENGSALKTVAFEPGSAPEGLTVGPASVWVALKEVGQIARVDRQTMEVIARIDVGAGPRAVVHDSGAVWVTNGDDDTVTLIDPLANEGLGAVLDTIEVGDEPHGVALGGGVWVANRDGDSVSWIDSESEAEPLPVVEIPVGDNPKGIAVDAGTVWVANTGIEGEDDGVLTPIDAETMAPGAPVPVGGDPRGVTAGLGRIWVSNGDGYVSEVDPATAEIIETHEVGSSPEEISTGGDQVWVSGGVADQILNFTP